MPLFVIEDAQMPAKTVLSSIEVMARDYIKIIWLMTTIRSKCVSRKKRIRSYHLESRRQFVQLKEEFTETGNSQLYLLFLK